MGKRLTSAELRAHGNPGWVKRRREEAAAGSRVDPASAARGLSAVPGPVTVPPAARDAWRRGGPLRRLSTGPLAPEECIFSNALRDLIRGIGHVSAITEFTRISRFRLDRFLSGEGRLRTDELDRLSLVFGLQPVFLKEPK